MYKNKAFEIADPAKSAITQKPVRPALRLVYGKTDGSLPNSNLSHLNRTEKDCCNRATD